ncbi:MAG: helix-turn-helix domain-containing protein [Oscillospiraceae bacterium]|nr:helix-turn-helix domain-containing protein [Oscillospiraceae bacterium]
MKFRLKEFRNKKGMTLKALSEASGVASSNIVLIESGNANPKAKTLYKLAKALGVPVGELFDCE